MSHGVASFRRTIQIPIRTASGYFQDHHIFCMVIFFLFLFSRSNPVVYCDTRMTPFKKNVLRVVSSIPKGSTMSYKEVARRAGSPHACRAVGSIMARNIDPAVPCHRVIRADGVLGGYNRGGARRKKALLQSEGVPVILSNHFYTVKACCFT